MFMRKINLDRLPDLCHDLDWHMVNIDIIFQIKRPKGLNVDTFL